jgi:hypothetical protein
MSSDLQLKQLNDGQTLLTIDWLPFSTVLAAPIFRGRVGPWQRLRKLTRVMRKSVFNHQTRVVQWLLSVCFYEFKPQV